MSEKINKNDVIEDKILSAFIQEAVEAEKRVKAFDERLKSLAKTFREDLSKSTDLNIDNLQKWNTLEKEAEKRVKQKKQNVKDLSVVEQERLKIQKAVEKAQAQKTLADSKENKELQKLRAEKNKINKATRDEIKQAERNKNAYTKLSDASRRYKNESKTLGAELLALEQAGKKNSRVWNETNKRYTQVTAKAKLTDAQLKKLDATVGDNQRSVGNYAKATRGLSRALGTLGVAVGVGQIFRNVGGIIADFNQAQTDLQAISGKTADELEPLTKQARDLGATTQFSASQVTGLQIELAKLGFTTQEITDSTGGIANFAAATGVEIPRAAALAGSALRAFNLDATEIDRVVSTLGVATTKTALDFSKLENGLSTVAPVAASFGFSIEDTTAVLGQLANAGFDASSAATATRNILLNLADSGGSLAQKLGRPIKSADDLAAGLQELQSQGVDLAEALELTDKRSVAAFSTFIEGSDSLVGLRDSITDVNGELQAMADKRIESVQGAMKLLSSAWEGFVLDLNDSISASDAFQKVIKFIAENLTTIIGTVARLGALMLIYSQRARIAAAANFLFNGGLSNMLKSIPRMIKGLKGASFSFRGLGAAMKSIPFVAIIAGLVELVTWLWNSEEATDANTEAEKELNDELERGNEIRELRVQNEKEIADLVDQREKLSQTQLKNLRNRIQEEIALSEERGASIIQSEKEIERAEFNRFRNEQELAQLRKELQETTNQFERDGLRQKIELLEEEQSDLETRLKLQKQGIELTDDESASQEQLNKWLSLVNPLIKQNTSRKKENTKATEKLTGAQEWQNEKNDEFLDQLDEYLEKSEKQRKDQQDEMDRIESGDFEVGIGEAPVLPEDEVDEVTDQQKELYDTINTAQENITKVYSDHVDRRIELAQKEIDSQQELRNILKAQAESGNIDAQDSIKATIEAEREKEAEIIRLEKRKQQVQMISQGIQTYLNLLEGGEKPAAALAQTAITSQGLIQLLSGLQGFWKGTEYAPEGLAWTQEKGAEIITDKKGNIKSLGSDSGSQLTYLEKGDKVKNASETTKFLNSFENLNNEQRMPKQDVAGNSYDIMLLGSKLDQVVKAVKSIPQSNSDFQTITKGLSVLTKTTNSGGDKHISKHYLKR